MTTLAEINSGLARPAAKWTIANAEGLELPTGFIGAATEIIPGKTSLTEEAQPRSLAMETSTRSLGIGGSAESSAIPGAP